MWPSLIYFPPILRRIFLFLFFPVIFAFFAPLSLAADLNIDCPAPPTVCTKSGLDPLFTSSLDGFWYPGKTITKTLNLKNSSPEIREMAIKGTRTSAVTVLEEVMQISIVPSGGGPVIWAGSVADFYNQEKIAMGTFVSGAELDYNFTVSMNLTAGDEYKNKETVFDLTLGFWGEPVPTATPTLTPTPTTTPVPTATPTPSGGGGGGGGAVLGAGVTAPTCSDTAPANAPTLTSAVAGVNSVALFWSEGAGPISYYLVAYGTSSGNYSFGNPNIGGPGTTSYTVSNLSGGTTYYFVVRAGNGCAPGPFSNELSATPLGGAVAGPAAGFFPGVLGVATPSAELTGTIVPTGEVAGEIVEITPFAPEGKPAHWGIVAGILLAVGIAVITSLFLSKKPVQV